MPILCYEAITSAPITSCIPLQYTTPEHILTLRCVSKTKPIFCECQLSLYSQRPLIQHSCIASWNHAELNSVWISLESDLLHSCLDQSTASLTLHHQNKFRSKHLDIKRTNAIICTGTLQAVRTMKLCVTIHRSTLAFVAWPVQFASHYRTLEGSYRYCLERRVGSKLNIANNLQALLVQICVA